MSYVNTMSYVNYVNVSHMSSYMNLLKSLVLHFFKNWNFFVNI